MSFQRVEQLGGTSLPRRPAPPGNGVGAGPEPQPPAGRHGGKSREDQPQPGGQQAAEDAPTGADPNDGGDPPGQAPGPAAHSAARSCRQVAWAEPPGRPTLVRTRTATTGRSAPVPASNSSWSSLRWARMAWRSAWLSGRTDPLGRSSSSKGHGRELAIGYSLSVRGPLVNKGPGGWVACSSLLAGCDRPAVGVRVESYQRPQRSEDERP